MSDIRAKAAAGWRTAHLSFPAQAETTGNSRSAIASFASESSRRRVPPFRASTSRNDTFGPRSHLFGCKNDNGRVCLAMMVKFDDYFVSNKYCIFMFVNEF